MATHYLLPCQCGKKNEVDSNQAGLTVRCECGADLPVPAMRGLANLERVERAPAASVASGMTWGRRQGLIFLGSVLLAFSALAALFFWAQMPSWPVLLPDYQLRNRQNNEQLSPEDSFNEWRELQKGIVLPEMEAHLNVIERITSDLMQWEMVCGGVAAVGLLLVVVGLSMSSRPRSSPQRVQPAHAEQ
jgi:hypothetical protein